MKYKGLEIKITKDEFVEGGKIYTILKDNLYITNYPSMSLAKEFINVFNYIWNNCPYSLDETIKLTINRVG